MRVFYLCNLMNQGDLEICPYKRKKNAKTFIDIYLCRIGNCSFQYFYATKFRLNNTRVITFKDFELNCFIRKLNNFLCVFEKRVIF